MTADAERPLRAVAAVLALAGIALVAGAALLWGAEGFGELPTSFARSVLPVVVGMLAAIAYLGAGWLLTSRVPRNPIGWLLLIMGLVFATMTPTALLVDAALRAFRPAPFPTLAAAWLLSSFSGPILGGAAIIAGLFFPDGHLAGPRWRWALVVSLVGAIMLALATAFRPGGLIWYPSLPNPSAAPSEIRPILSGLMVAASVPLAAGAALMVLSLISRYRRGDAAVRAQLRWILFTDIAMAAVMVPVFIIRFVLPVAEAAGEVTVALADATLAFLPIAAAVAITRYRLFGIDFIIGRTLVYLPMMAILGGLYTASITIFQRVFVAVTGQSSDLPLVITVFLVATAFTPIRRGLEGIVDRWIHAAPSRGQLPGSPTQDMEPAVAEVAASIVTLRRLEARVVAGPGLDSSRRPGQRIPIDEDGRVACPLGGTPNFLACLGCRHFAALITDPPAVVCTQRRR